MAEIVEMEKRVVALNATEAKTTTMKIWDEQVVVAAETNMGHKEGSSSGNDNATKGAPQGGA